MSLRQFWNIIFSLNISPALPQEKLQGTQEVCFYLESSMSRVKVKEYISVKFLVRNRFPWAMFSLYFCNDLDFAFASFLANVYIHSVTMNHPCQKLDKEERQHLLFCALNWLEICFPTYIGKKHFHSFRI